jgi:hypothetical protein
MADEYQARRDIIIARHDTLASAYQEAGLKYSVLVITNLMLINAGGLLALATELFGESVFDTRTALLPASLFVGGLMAAILCGYLAYLNTGALVAVEREFKTIELWTVAKRHISTIAAETKIPPDVPAFMDDGRSFADFVADTDNALKVSQGKIKGNNRFISATFGGAQIVGVASGLLFVAACILLVLSLTGSATTLTAN